MRRTYRQDPKTGKFVEVTPLTRKVADPVTDDITPMVSPVDGSVIRTKKQLQHHNHRYGVSNDLDSLQEQTRKAKARQDAPLPKEDRIQDLVRGYDYVQHNSILFPRRRP